MNAAPKPKIETQLIASLRHLLIFPPVCPARTFEHAHSPAILWCPILNGPPLGPLSTWPTAKIPTPMTAYARACATLSHAENLAAEHPARAIMGNGKFDEDAAVEDAEEGQDLQNGIIGFNHPPTAKTHAQKSSHPFEQRDIIAFAARAGAETGALEAPLPP
ncbi:hypothetical protein BST61_g7973 [Cercospora zeina]